MKSPEELAKELADITLPSEEIYEADETEMDLHAALKLLDECRDLLTVVRDAGIRHLLSPDLMREFRRVQKTITKLLNDYEVPTIEEVSEQDLAEWIKEDKGDE